MSCYSDVWPILATFDTEYPFLINFRQVRLKWLRMPYDASKWQILHNVASNRSVWSLVGNDCHHWSRISSLNELVHFQAELGNRGLVYQVIACTALWDKIGQIWSDVAYNGPVFLIVSRYDRLGPRLSLYYFFCAILALSIRFDDITIKVQAKRDSGQKWSIIIQYVLLQRGMTNYGHIGHSRANSDQFSTSAPEMATYGLWRQLVPDFA